VPRQFVGYHAVQRDVLGPIQHVGEWNLLCGLPDRDLHTVIAHEQLELLGEIVAEQVGPGDRGGVGARRAEASVGAVQPRPLPLRPPGSAAARDRRTRPPPRRRIRKLPACRTP
jgi:hypothetical protein